MKRNSFEIETVEEMLRQAPERQVPAGLQERIMAEILTCRPPRSLAGTTRRWWQRIPVFGFQPLRVGAAIAMAAAAFWLGTVAGGRDQAGMTPGRSPGAQLAPFANSAQANYLVGRGLLEAGNKRLALEFFQQAVLQEPQSAEYGHWQGVTYWQLGDPDKERQSYQQSIARHPDYIPALLDLGHNLLESGAYQESLRQYAKVLQVNPYEQTALYNQALSYHQLKDQAGEQQAFIRYLDQYRSDKWAYRAVEHLQRLGVFDYRACLIGNRKVVVNQQVLLGPAQPARQLELERLARWLEKSPAGELHLVVYFQNDRERGKAIAGDLKQQLLTIMGGESTIPIRISWFDEPSSIRTANGTEQKLAQGLVVFTQPLPKQGSTI